MSSSKKPPGSIHRVREFELEKIHLVDEFDILQIVGEGWFGKILLVEHRATDTEMVLKAVPKPYVSLRDFYREFHYGLHLGIHKNIVTTFDVAFETAGFYVFTQEYAPLGDLTSNVADSGIGELHSKRVAKQIASALDYMHSKDIVHRDVKLDNVLIYRSDFSRVKLCDFGESYQTGSLVERRNEWLPYSPPEVLSIQSEGNYKADPSHDIWQFAIVIFVCLTGCLPWQKAALDDPRYVRYLTWQNTIVLPVRRTPKLFKLLASKASRMFRRLLEPRPDRRPKNLADLSKFMDDRWLAKTAIKDMAEYEPDELCPSMYSFHSSPDEKNRLLHTLAEHGIETTVDRVLKKNRIRDWIESSVINEDDEEEESGSASPSSSVSRDPVPGHISSLRVEEAKKQIISTIKDASKKHFDPRTGALQEGPSAMGTAMMSTQLSNRSTINNSSLNGSLITLGSRNDLISSHGHSMTSDLNLNMLGELPPEPMVNARQNVPLNNTTNAKSVTDLNAMQHYNGTLALSYPHALQRTRSDSVKAALVNPKMYASSSAINLINNSSKLFEGQLSVGGTTRGAPNAFQSLAQMPINVSPPPSTVKDSGYGSYDKIRPSQANGDQRSHRMPASEMRSKDASYPHQQGQRNISNNLNNNNRMKQNGRSAADNNNTGAGGHNFHSGSSMKDTAYDRVKVFSNGNRKR